MIGISLMSIAITAHAGHYKGDGNWAGSVGGTGAYTVESDISIDGKVRVSSAYVIAGAHMGDAYVVSDEANGFFKVRGDDGAVRGDGYCLGSRCHVSMPGDKLEESIVFGDDGCMERFGSKIEMGSPWSWSERLCPAGG